MPMTTLPRSVSGSIVYAGHRGKGQKVGEYDQLRYELSMCSRYFTTGARIEIQTMTNIPVRIKYKYKYNSNTERHMAPVSGNTVNRSQTTTLLIGRLAWIALLVFLTIKGAEIIRAWLIVSMLCLPEPSDFETTIGSTAKGNTYTGCSDTHTSVMP